MLIDLNGNHRTRYFNLFVLVAILMVMIIQGPSLFAGTNQAMTPAIESDTSDSLNFVDSSTNNSPAYQLNRQVPNSAFRVGEKLSFVIRYGFIKAGNAEMQVEGIVPLDDREAYRIVSTARSNGTFDVFFKVRDRVESYIDTRGLYSLRFNKMLREGSYKFDLLVDYDQPDGKANVQMIRYDDDNDSLQVKKKEDFEVAIPPYVLDILASFYFVRTQKLRLGMPLYITNHDNKKVYDLKVLIQKRETIKVKAGKFRCVVVEPVLKGESIFQQKGKLWVWLSDDQYKIPVQMKSAVFVGNITTELTDIEGIRLPLPSQVK